MRRRAVVLGVLLLVGIGAACSSFTGTDDPAPPTSDAGPDVVDDATDASVAVSDGCVDICPELFAGNQAPIRAMAADGNTLYWTVARQDPLVMYRSFAAEGGAESLINTDGAIEIAVDDRYLYFTNLTILTQIPKDGGEAPIVDNNYQTTVVVDDTNVYWSNGNDGYVHRKAKAHLDSDIQYVKLADPSALALDDTYLFVVDHSHGLQAYPKAASVPAELQLESATDPARPHSRLAAGGGAIFFRSSVLDLESIDVHGNGARYVISDAGATVSLDSDGTNVFWTEDSDPDGGTSVGRVRRATAKGGAVTDLATLQAHPTLIVVGGDHIYWVVAQPDGTSAIMRRPL